MNLNTLFVMLADATPAAAPTTTAPGTQMQQNSAAQFLGMIGPIALMLGVAYLMFIRPQSKRNKEHATLLQGLRPGDKVVTSGGVVGTVVSVKEKTISLRSAETKMEVLKSAISDVTERGEISSSES